MLSQIILFPSIYFFLSRHRKVYLPLLIFFIYTASDMMQAIWHYLFARCNNLHTAIKKAATHALTSGVAADTIELYKKERNVIFSLNQTKSVWFFASPHIRRDMTYLVKTKNLLFVRYISFTHNAVVSKSTELSKKRI